MLLKIDKNRNKGFLIPSEIKASAKTYIDKNGEKIPGQVTPYLHCYTAGKIAERLLKPNCAEPDIIPKSAVKWLAKFIPIKFIPFLVALHDVGKISSGFQALIRGKRNFDNMKYGLAKHAIMSYLHTEAKIGDLSKCILYHHGHYRGNGKKYSLISTKDGWADKRDVAMEKLMKDFSIKESDFKEFKKIRLSKYNLTYFKYITGIFCMSDWLASDGAYFSPSGYEKSEVQKIIKKILCDSNLYRTNYDSIPEKVFKEVFKNKKIFKPNNIQKSLIDKVSGPGLYILEGSTGGGKTEAALYPALKLCRERIASGLYFSLPTQITSNNIFLRVGSAISNWFGKNRTHLIHSNADIVYREETSTWFNGSKKALLDEFGTGTIDQILLSVIPQSKFFFLRTFGLYNKVVILDEVHSYDVYTSGLIIQLIRELIELDCIVIVLSATLTEKFKKELLDAV